jgi:eukaryotic-like serine/threonine-protein kinase
MTPQAATTRWRQVETLFHQTAAITPDSRAAFLDVACQGDLELRAELESLLSSSDQTLSDLQHSVAAAAGDVLDCQNPDLARIGPYRLIRTLGEGGMGTVYLGERDDDQYHRVVAIKVLRAGLTRSPALQLLFRSERQILADLDHPNIARMLDGGITTHGSPYLVMEYIDGTPPDVFSRERGLGLDARLRLFRMLCTAVDYAHRHLIIHRDIKPLNVLVTADGSPKLLDFGIAKLIDPIKESGDLEARGGERLLTPDYASPEQLLDKPISTATDVYALGVLLFELLAGEPPFTGLEPGARARAICEDEAERPSATCLRTGNLPPADARRLRGDLDSIILKALRKDPGERYASASQLLDDLDRYLGGYAVEAADQSIAYRIRKFVRRHRTGVAITGLVGLLILVFAVGMAVLARRATRGEAKARREEQFMASIFNAATPEGSKGENVTARQLLDQGAKRVGTELGSDPQLQAAMAEDIGEAYVALGLYDQAQPLLERALHLVGSSEGQSSPDYADDLSNLASDYRLMGQFAKAEPLFRRAVALNETAHGANSLPVAQNLGSLGECLYLEDNDLAAEPILRRALAIDRSQPQSSLDGARNYLALLLERKGEYPEAGILLRESVAITARSEGTQSQNYLVSLHNLAGAQIDMGDLDGAAKSEQEVLATRRRIWGPSHPDTAYSLNNLGWIYLELGRWQDAEPLLRENLEVIRKAEIVPGVRYANDLGNWGRVLEQKGDLSGASQAFAEAQRVLASAGKSDTWIAAKVLICQAQVDLDLRETEDALQLATRAVQLQKKLGGDANPQLAAGELTLGSANLLAGDAAAAEAAFRVAVEIRKRTFPPTHRDLLLAQVRLAEALLDEDRTQDALKVMQSAMTSVAAAPFPLPPWQMAELQIVNALALRRTGRESDLSSIVAANAGALGTYPQAAMRSYLKSRIKGGSARREGV